MEQNLVSFLEHLQYAPVFGRVHVAQLFSTLNCLLCTVFFVFFSFFSHVVVCLFYFWFWLSLWYLSPVFHHRVFQQATRRVSNVKHNIYLSPVINHKILRCLYCSIFLYCVLLTVVCVFFSFFCCCCFEVVSLLTSYESYWPVDIFGPFYWSVSRIHMPIWIYVMHVY